LPRELSENGIIEVCPLLRNALFVPVDHRKSGQHHRVAHHLPNRRRGPESASKFVSVLFGHQATLRIDALTPSVEECVDCFFVEYLDARLVETAEETSSNKGLRLDCDPTTDIELA
jgi:hypothetical protein